jgi:hypothetical protein
MKWNEWLKSPIVFWLWSEMRAWKVQLFSGYGRKWIIWSIIVFWMWCEVWVFRSSCFLVMDGKIRNYWSSCFLVMDGIFEFSSLVVFWLWTVKWEIIVQLVFWLWTFIFTLVRITLIFNIPVYFCTFGSGHPWSTLVRRGQLWSVTRTSGQPIYYCVWSRNFLISHFWSGFGQSGQGFLFLV